MSIASIDFALIGIVSVVNLKGTTVCCDISANLNDVKIGDLS